MTSRSLQCTSFMRVIVPLSVVDCEWSTERRTRLASFGIITSALKSLSASSKIIFILFNMPYFAAVVKAIDDREGRVKRNQKLICSYCSLQQLSEFELFNELFLWKKLTELRILKSKGNSYNDFSYKREFGSYTQIILLQIAPFTPTFLLKNLLADDVMGRNKLLLLMVELHCQRIRQGM